jgi:hypothetical protein
MADFALEGYAGAGALEGSVLLRSRVLIAPFDS